MTVIIRNADLIESVADALQYISYFHPMDYIRALGDAYAAEQSPAAKDACAQRGIGRFAKILVLLTSSLNGVWIADWRIPLHPYKT
jgi:hypothetical protein